ncbi:hypothetical protein GGX14DRAFT_616235 [Mycena pura]|uniref:EH domain-containing protein n=1 Tax=Mycena pura TaxID=153505 RepID=A0AAD6YTN6_9AGAR|nr:hypothetical protein GGX14DRAFT_616235 [Mycena pura]
MPPTFLPSAEELALVDKIFSRGEPHKLGILTGDVALDLFSKSNVSFQLLSEIWNIVDRDGHGWLAPNQTAAAVRLIGWAQVGVKPALELLGKPGPLAHIQDVSSADAGPSKIASFVPPFTAEDKSKFRRVFLNSDPRPDGLIDGDKAREIFSKSKLPVDKLSEVWKLSDTQHRGALDVTDFAIAMHLIQWLMNSGQSAILPNFLPDGIYEQAAAEPSSPLLTTPSSASSVASNNYLSVQTDLGGRSASGPSIPWLAAPSSSSTTSSNNYITVQTDLNGRAASELSSPSFTTLPSPSATSNNHLAVQTDSSRRSSRSPSVSSNQSDEKSRSPGWVIPPDVRARADRQFDALDPLKNGTIQYNISLPFFLESKLSPSDVASIWALSDLNGDGKLNRDGFAIAWFLIDERRRGNPLPTSLPSSLRFPDISHGPGFQARSTKTGSFSSPPTRPPLPPKQTNSIPPPPPLKPPRLWAGKDRELQHATEKTVDSKLSQLSINESLRPRASTVAYPALHPQPGNVRVSSVWTPDEVFVNEAGQPSSTPRTPVEFQNATVVSLTRQMEEMQKLTTQLRLSNADKNTAITNLTQENGSLRAVIDELQVQAVSYDRESSNTVNEVLLKENEGLRAAMQQMEETLRQLQASSSDVEMQRIQYEDLVRENERLAEQVQEMRGSTTQLPWSGGDSELQTLINEDLSRENARLRTEAREMQENVAQLQEATSGYEEQRRVNAELVRENERLHADAQARQTGFDAQQRELRQLAGEVERLKAQLQTSATTAGPSGSNDADVPPPAYDAVDSSLL